MPNDSISIVIKAEGRYSAVLKTMSSVMKSFEKNAEHLERTLRVLSGEKSVLKAETGKARKAMQEAQKQSAATGDAADGSAASPAGQEYGVWRRKLEAVNQAMKTAAFFHRRLLFCSAVLILNGDAHTAINYALSIP